LPAYEEETIAKQLCLVLSEQQKSDIAHLNITPENIIVNEESAIMVREFIYGMQIPEEGEVEIERKVPKSPFIAPEVRRGIACLDADIYSMGKILEKLEFKKCKKDTNSSVDHSKRIETILNLIDAMTVKDRTERITLNEVYQTLFPNKKKVKRLRSLSEGGMQSSYLSSSSMSSSKSQFGSKQAYAEILMKILRHRNISWFLLRLFKRIVVNIKLNSELTVILGVIMLKKSTKLLASLGKYLHYGRNDIGIDINAKDQTRFFKTTDYHKICEIIGNPSPI
jgi:serine/threonine protein kinase